MKKSILIILFLVLTSFQFEDNNHAISAYTSGEWFEFRMHYENFINAGKVEISLKEVKFNNQKAYHAKGYGYTTGLTKLFFKVEDDYQSIFDIQNNKPFKYVRKINEGGYTKDQVGYFDQSKKTVLVKDLKNKTEESFKTTEFTQDMLSSFYYLRNHPKVDDLKENESIDIDMFFDGEIYNFQLKFLGKEDVKTKFGQVPALKFRPFVQAGRVFKEKESLTIWVTADKNKLPIKMKAELAVGALHADIERFKGLKHPFMVRKSK